MNFALIFRPFIKKKFYFILGLSMAMEIFNLNLVSSLFYYPVDEPGPFSFGGPDGESAGIIAGSGRGNGCASREDKLFCFELDEELYRSIEPDAKKLIKKLIFSGKAAGNLSGEGLLELPSGNYLFAQKRETLRQEDLLAMAVEVQQEALWQRLEAGKKLYLRCLFEDGAMVTQIYRPYT